MYGCPDAIDSGVEDLRDELRVDRPTHERLAAEALDDAGVRREPVDGDDLDGDAAPRAAVAGLEYRPHTALSEQADDLVLAVQERR